MAGSRFPNSIDSWDFFPIWHVSLVCNDERNEGDGADRAGVIGLIRQVAASVGLEADKPLQKGV